MSDAGVASRTTWCGSRSGSRMPTTWWPISSAPWPTTEEADVATTPEMQIRLDGGLATELEKAGVSVTAPWWTTSALLTEQRRRALRCVHAAYLEAGAQVITANTFRCNIRA